MRDFSFIDPYANESKANLRYLEQRSGKPLPECLAALRAHSGDLVGALRSLAPHLPLMRFPDWYYLGPHKKVDDPDRDLPVREGDGHGRCDTDLEVDRNLGGERLIAPFNDSNSLGDIVGCLLVVAMYPSANSDDLLRVYGIQRDLAEATDRIRNKLRRNRNPIRAQHFENAVRAVELAKDLYFDRQYAEAEELAWCAERLLREGNKAKG